MNWLLLTEREPPGVPPPHQVTVIKGVSKLTVDASVIDKYTTVPVADITDFMGIDIVTVLSIPLPLFGLGPGPASVSIFVPSSPSLRVTVPLAYIAYPPPQVLNPESQTLNPNHKP